MNQVMKDEILKQVGAVLQFCQEIVTKLSNPQCCCDTSEYASMSLTKTFISDFDSQYEHSACRSSGSSTPLQRWPTYHDIPKVADEYSIPEAADEYSIPKVADEYKVLNMVADEFNLLMEDVTMRKSETVMLPPDISRDLMMEANMTMPTKPENVLMQSVVEFLNVVTPDAIYHPNWREEQKRKAVHPEFYNLWKSYDSIFTDVKDDNVDIIKDPAPAIRYHSIDLFNVNTRFIENIPKPSSFPIHGVSPDPDFYHKLARGEGEYSHKIFYRFNRHSPFGSDYGYETHIGIVPPPTDPVHGYIWCEGSWKLYAVKPGEEVSSSRRRRG